ncbi:stage II sporulation protein M [Paenibacillus terreus]|uniref:Stage II sporulation protein M n=1 Tax=Paenibacillus terreus TaxID=1387834 RepID=A0ABV5B1Y8_9BACL
MQLLRHSLAHRMPLYVFLGVLFLVGVVFGALMVNALTLEQQQELGRYLNNFFVSVGQDGGAADPTLTKFWEIASLHLKWAALIWICGLSVIGLPGILVLNFLKGVLIGFSVGFVVGQYSWKGLLFALVSVAPHNVVVIPVLLVCSVAAMTFSIQMIKDRMLLTRRPSGFVKPFASYAGLTAVMMLFLLGSASFETWVTPVMMRWVTPLLMSAGAV